MASFSSIFSLSSQAIRNLLDGVRETRNDLAHFHDEISAYQRDQLHFCADWLERHRTKVSETFGAAGLEILPSTATKDLGTLLKLADDPLSQNENSSTAGEITPSVEILGPDDSRYALLALWLQQRSLNQEKVSLTFEAIEEIIRGKLPPSARKHRAWWSNHLEYSPQARQWWDAGWRVSTVNMTQETMDFSRIEERKKAYIDFFSSLLAQLSKEKPFPMRNPSPDGEGWVIIAGLPTHGASVAYLGFSFARKKRFRIDMYIDMGKDKERENKALFQKLRDRKEIIEAELGTSASWEYLEESTRIAYCSLS